MRGARSRAVERMAGRRLSVLQLVPALEAGGVEQGTLEIGRALAGAGHRSIVVSGGGRLVARLREEGSEHLAWPIGAKSLRALALVPRLRALIEAEGVDIVHARSRVPAWVAWFALGRPRPGDRGRGGLRSGGRQRPAFVTTAHGFYTVSPYSAIMTRGDRVIAVSEAIARHLREHYPALDPERIELIPRGVDRSRFPHGYRPPERWMARWLATHPEGRGADPCSPCRVGSPASRGTGSSSPSSRPCAGRGFRPGGWWREGWTPAIGDTTRRCAARAGSSASRARCTGSAIGRICGRCSRSPISSSPSPSARSRSGARCSKPSPSGGPWWAGTGEGWGRSCRRSSPRAVCPPEIGRRWWAPSGAARAAGGRGRGDAGAPSWTGRVGRTDDAGADPGALREAGDAMAAMKGAPPPPPRSPRAGQGGAGQSGPARQSDELHDDATRRRSGRFRPGRRHPGLRGAPGRARGGNPLLPGAHARVRCPVQPPAGEPEGLLPEDRPGPPPRHTSGRWGRWARGDDRGGDPGGSSIERFLESSPPGPGARAILAPRQPPRGRTGAGSAP